MRPIFIFHYSGSRSDWMIEKFCEIGVRTVIPIETSYTKSTGHIEATEGRHNRYTQQHHYTLLQHYILKFSPIFKAGLQ